MCARYLVLDPAMMWSTCVEQYGTGFIQKAQREVEPLVVLSSQSLAFSILPCVWTCVSLRSVHKLMMTADTATASSIIPVSGSKLPQAKLQPNFAQIRWQSRITCVLHVSSMAYGIGLCLVMLGSVDVIIQQTLARPTQQSSEQKIASSFSRHGFHQTCMHRLVDELLQARSHW